MKLILFGMYLSGATAILLSDPNEDLGLLTVYTIGFIALFWSDWRDTK